MIKKLIWDKIILFIMKAKYLIIYLLLFIFYKVSYPQETNNNSITNDNVYGRSPANTEVSITGYKDIKLGSTKEETINAILNDNTMILPKKYLQNNVDISAEDTESFISLVPNKFYRSGYFVFKDDSLYSITINFQPNQFDFLEMLNKLNAKYGKGNFLDANTISWQNSDIKMILERPSIIKYISIEHITTTSDTRIRTAKENNAQNNVRQSILEGL